QLFKGAHDKVRAAQIVRENKNVRAYAEKGMSHEEWCKHVAEYGNSMTPGSPFHRFCRQRMNAKARGIEWNLSFADWWRIWRDSGKWDQRGRGYRFNMARYGDSGPYSEENVYICTGAQNASDSYLTKPASARVAKRKKKP
ncbi:MAG: hypothetical protein AAAC47_21105, partial [Pararhizobium sp.]